MLSAIHAVVGTDGRTWMDALCFSLPPPRLRLPSLAPFPPPHHGPSSSSRLRESERERMASGGQKRNLPSSSFLLLSLLVLSVPPFLRSVPSPLLPSSPPQHSVYADISGESRLAQQAQKALWDGRGGGGRMMPEGCVCVKRRQTEKGTEGRPLQPTNQPTNQPKLSSFSVGD